MKTAKGSNYDTLFNIHSDNGTLTIRVAVPMRVEYDIPWMNKALPFIKERIASEKKPAVTFERCIEQIEQHMGHLVAAYVRLYDTYTTATTVATRQSPIDKARTELFESIPDMKMLRAMCALHIGDSRANDYVLPDERAELINTTVQAMKTTGTSNGVVSE